MGNEQLSEIEADLLLGGDRVGFCLHAMSADSKRVGYFHKQSHIQ
jgi:hypothetical protein